MRRVPRGWSAVGALACATAGLLLALALTPPASVSAFGQDLRLGAVSPLALRGWSGPGQADLFGEGPVETALTFPGPIRPRIVWQRFERDPAAAEFVQVSSQAGPTFRTAELGDRLARGWSVYLLRLVLVAGLLAALLRLLAYGVLMLLHHPADQLDRRRASALQVGAAFLAGVALTVVSASATLLSARDQLADVSGLADITGRAPLVPLPAAPVAEHADVELAVIGDSTAAAVGNTDLPHPTQQDTQCGRSRDAYAAVLGSALRIGTLNLACSSATIEAGLLGPQPEDRSSIPSQVGALAGLPRLTAVVVSIGANDVGWADALRLCYGLERCDDQFSQTYFDSLLDGFRIRYAELLAQLAALPGRPRVVVVQYYDPFGERFDCPALHDPGTPAQPPPAYGFAPDAAHDQQTQLERKIAPLRSRLEQLNSVLAQGADAFGFDSVRPSFEGHALCDDESWVQGMSARYPFHPNAAGELAIAAALLPQLVGVGQQRPAAGG